MSRWKIIYYEKKDGSCPIEDFINKRSIKNKAKILSLFEYLEERGPNLPRPYADLLKNGIHELRIKLSGEQIRIMYFFVYKEFIVLSNVFTKNSSKVPEKEIKKAMKCKEDFLKRIKEKELKEKFK